MAQLGRRPALRARAAIERPASVEELAEAIGGRGARGLRVRVAGAGHSFSDVALHRRRCCSGSSGMHRVLDVDRASGLVTRAGRASRSTS